ncbi:multidrug resistance protein fnx1 [Pestalotiopsis sp. NC0098]|nr:multidrug resistance protein fnx1 [Pestalotiopsis sp. NC0098]
MSGEQGAPAHDASGGGSITGAASERTALLAAAPRSHHYQHQNLYDAGHETESDDDDDGERLDAHESELLLARTASISSAVGLAPEAASEGAMFQHRLQKQRSSGSLFPPATPGYDVEEGAPLLGTAAADKSERQYLINTNFRHFVTIFAAIMLGSFLSIFDGTIMASSHPVITSYFHSSNSASWLSTAFLLTSTASQPLLGRLSESIGRKPPYIATTVIFAAATAWCGLATSMTSFIIARAVCGVGAGGIMALGTIIISDLVPIEQRGTYQSYVNVVFGLASAAGAALGGLMADTLGWRWEFGVQVPAILLCLVAIIILVPNDLGLVGKRETFMEAMRVFDFKGSILLTASTTFLILGLNLGGNVLPWGHPLITTSLVLFAVCFPACLWAESKAERPIMPLALLHSSPRANLIFANFTGALIANAVLFNVPLYFQAVLLTSATESGVRLIVPQVTGATFGTATGLLISWTKRLKWPLVLGTSLTLLGTTVLSSMQRGWPWWAYLLCLMPTAAGQGFHFPGTFLAVLATSEQREQAVVSSTLVLWRSLGAILGVACSSLIMQNALLSFLRRYVTSPDAAAVIERVRESVEEVARLEGDVLEQVVRSYEDALRLTLLCCVGLALVSCILVFPIRLPKLGEKRR